MRAIGGAEHAVDHRDRADLEQILRPGGFQLGVAGGDQRDQALVAGHHVVHQPDRARLADCQRDGRLGVDDQAAQREHRQHARDLVVWADQHRLFGFGRVVLDDCG